MGRFNQAVLQCLHFIERYSKSVVIFLVLIASVRVVITWYGFNATTDEAAHVACGMEWLDRGTYRLEDQHPPLARIAVALGPYLLGGRSPGGLDLIL